MSKIINILKIVIIFMIQAALPLTVKRLAYYLSKAHGIGYLENSQAYYYSNYFLWFIYILFFVLIIKKAKKGFYLYYMIEIGILLIYMYCIMLDSLENYRVFY